MGCRPKYKSKKVLTLLEENIGENLNKLALGKDVLN